MSRLAKTRSAIKRSDQSSTSSVTVATQTESEDYKNELSNCLKMIESLKLEITELKKDTQIFKSQNISIATNKELFESSIISKNGSTSKSNKGCKCKANCSTKQCGCVKKDNKCGEFCKCNSMKCKNQEAEKENAEPNVFSPTIRRRLYTVDTNDTVNIDNNENEELDTSVKPIVPKLNFTRESSSSSNSENSEDTHLNPMVPRRELPRSPVKFEDADLNPMIPRYQLPRSPIQTKDACLNPIVPTRQLSRSPVNSEKSMTASSKEKRFSSVKEDLASEKIDWDKHQAELVVCKLCNRKFFPYRIDKHVKSCKGI